jgi:O-antigen ligase
MPSVALKTEPSRSARAWPVLLVLAVLVLLPIGRGAELPLVAGTIAGVVLCLRRRVDFDNAGVRLACALFACYWLAALASGFAPVDPGRTWSTIGVTLRFLPFALFACWALGDEAAWPRLGAAAAAIVVLWMLDAYVQITFGHSLGGAAEAERVSGIFGAGNLKLGPVLATLSPFLMLAARARFGLRGLVLAAACLVAPVLLSGSRAAWVAYALVCVLLAWHETRRPRRFLAVMATFALGVAAITAWALHDSTRFGARVERTLLALQGTEAALDEASAGRLSIWRTALAMGAAHPLTGVGVRGFRYDYPDHAARGDRFVEQAGGRIGAAHAHQIVLEVLSETGVFGLLSWMVGASLALRAWWRADAAARERARAPALALVAMTFPLNTHLAFYSAWWGLLFWWLLALYCAALGASARVRAETAEA